MYEWGELFYMSFYAGIVWAVFTVVWFCVSICMPQANTLGMDLFISVITLARSCAWFLLTYFSVHCEWDLSINQFVLLFATFAEGMFTMLELFISRGFGLTRFSLTLTEKVMFGVVSLGLMIVLVFPIVALLYLVIYVLFIIYATRTEALLKTQLWGEEMNGVMRKKHEAFWYIIILVIAGVSLSVVLEMMQLYEVGDREYRDARIGVFFAIQVTFAVEIMSLHMFRKNPMFYIPLVSTDEVYLLHQSLTVPRLEEEVYAGLPQQYNAPEQYPQAMPAVAPYDIYPPLDEPNINRRP